MLWCNGKASDVQSSGFNFQLMHCYMTTSGKLITAWGRPHNYYITLNRGEEGWQFVICVICRERSSLC